jgi:ubiquinone/menaquinone biosynthesis C-methylase UbiE
MEHTIKKDVLALYKSHPFPRWNHGERQHRLSAELCRYRFLGLEDAMKDARFLDIGCGTGNRSMLIAKHLGVKEFVGFDQSSESLQIAQDIASEEGMSDRFTPSNGDLFNLPFTDGSFDVVVSWGVLHHTPDPFAGLREAMRVCKPGGFVALFLYNKYNHWRHNIQKNRVSRLSGPDIEKRFSIAHELYGQKNVNEMAPDEIAAFYDQYCHPHKSDHTIGSTLGWFDQLDLEYHGSYPPLRFDDALPWLQYRAALREEFPLRQGNKLTWLLNAVERLPKAEPKSSYIKPNHINSFFWQAIYAWMGRNGDYSQGAALSARKSV